jgi:hypothetical protein
MAFLEFNINYPDEKNITFESKIVRIDLDKEMQKDIDEKIGFFIKDAPPINKSLKRTDTIYSELFMKTLHKVQLLYLLIMRRMTNK